MLNLIQNRNKCVSTKQIRRDLTYPIFIIAYLINLKLLQSVCFTYIYEKKKSKLPLNSIGLIEVFIIRISISVNNHNSIF